MNSPNSSLSNPFPGLRAFEENESHLFFGRTKHLSEIFNKLETHHFVALVGSSGSGKSSLVKAGIIPTLAKDPDWILTRFRPGADPMFELAKALSEKLDPGVTDSASLLNTLKASVFGIAEFTRKYLPQGKKLFILVDQFEEIFRFQESLESESTNKNSESESFKNRTHFIDLLLEAYNQREIGIYVMLTLRSDFIGDCDIFFGLPEAMNNGQYLIPRLRKDELEQIINGPVHSAGGKIAPRLVQRLIGDIGGSQEQLPVLQHALMRTWENWEPTANSGQPIDIDNYLSTGGIELALDNHAEEGYGSLNNYEKPLVSRIFKCITTKTSDNRGIRRPIAVKQIMTVVGCSEAELWKAVAPFRKEQRGFLLPTEKVKVSENSILDISHESLMRNWKRLNAWVDEEYESSSFYRRLAESAQLYTDGKTGLWRDPDLQIAEGWRDKQKPNINWALLYDPNFELSMRFLDESLAEKKRMLAEKKRRSFISRAAIASFLATSGVLSLWAFRERNAAEVNAGLALIQQKEAESQGKLALEQSAIATKQTSIAQGNLAIAEVQKKEAEKQKNIAENNLKEAALQKELAIASEHKANEQRNIAENERILAVRQTKISDSLRISALASEKQANRLRLLALADNLANKSLQLKEGEQDAEIKPLIVLEAYRILQENGGNTRDPQLLNAFLSAESAAGIYIKPISAHTNLVRSICYLGQSSKLASTGDDGNVFVTEDNISTLLFHKEEILSNIASDADAKYIVCSGENSPNFSIYFTPTESASKITQIKEAHSAEITGLSLVHDNLISVSLDKQLKIRKIGNLNATIASYTLPDQIMALASNHKSDLVYLVCENGNLYSFNTLQVDKAPVLISILTKGKPNSLSLSPDEKTIAIGTYEGNVLLFNTQTKTVKNNLKHHESKVTSCDINAAGFLISSSLDQTLKMTDLQAPDALPLVLMERAEWIYSAKFNYTGAIATTGGKAKEIKSLNISIQELRDNLLKAAKRNLTEEEWIRYIGKDIPYHKTISD